MLEHMKAPVKAIVGAWNHTYPDEPYPKPGFEWKREIVRWFDQWLKGRNTGIMEEPRLAVYVRKWHPPGPYLEEAPGAGATRKAGRSPGSASARSIRGPTARWPRRPRRRRPPGCATCRRRAWRPEGR